MTVQESRPRVASQRSPLYDRPPDSQTVHVWEPGEYLGRVQIEFEDSRGGGPWYQTVYRAAVRAFGAGSYEPRRGDGSARSRIDENVFAHPLPFSYLTLRITVAGRTFPVRRGATMMRSAKRNDVGPRDRWSSRVHSLVGDLTSRARATREKARESLVALGKPAVPSLIPLLSHRKPHVRWEAAKTLCDIADPIAATALVNALEDEDGDVRWLAAEGLIALGRDGLQPLLTALLERAQSGWSCEGDTTSATPWSGRKGLLRFSVPCWQPSNRSSRRSECRWLLIPHYRNCERCRENTQVRPSQGITPIEPRLRQRLAGRDIHVLHSGTFRHPRYFRSVGGVQWVLRPRGRIVVVAVSKECKDGFTIQAFEWTHRHFPNLMDCRPIYARRALEAAGLVIEDSLSESM